MSTVFQLRTNPEIEAGGYSRRSGTRDFYQRIERLIDANMTILDYGAGRGVPHVQVDPWIINFRGKVAKIVGCDLDPVVLENPSLDEAVVLEKDARLPFEDQAFDLIFADWVLEHIESPVEFAREIDRILKSGGWFCARTPSSFSYISIGSRLIPEPLQSRILHIVQPGREDVDVFPKFYRLNTRAAIRRVFSVDRFLDASYSFNPDPAYHGGRLWLYKLLDLYQSLPFEVFKSNRFVFLRKK